MSTPTGLPGVINVAIVGASGRMGTLAASTIDAASGLQLVAKIGRDDPLSNCEGAHVIVDFSTPESALCTAEWAIDNGVHVVLGTTGLGAAELSSIEKRLINSTHDTAVMVIPNLSVSALLTRKFAAQAVKYFDSCEIIEYAHPRKLEAPSGTALETAREIGQAMKLSGAHNPTEAESSINTGVRGIEVNGIQIHSVRLDGMMNHQTVLLGGPNDFMTLRYDTFDREAYMVGMQMAIRQIISRQGFFRGLESVIEI